jgi:hypothetical protein
MAPQWLVYIGAPQRCRILQFVAYGNFHVCRWYLPLQARPKALTFRSTVCRWSRGPIVCHEDRSSFSLDPVKHWFIVGNGFPI